MKQWWDIPLKERDPHECRKQRLKHFTAEASDWLLITTPAVMFGEQILPKAHAAQVGIMSRDRHSSSAGRTVAWDRITIYMYLQLWSIQSLHYFSLWILLINGGSGTYMRNSKCTLSPNHSWQTRVMSCSEYPHWGMLIGEKLNRNRMRVKTGAELGKSH